MKTLKSTWVEKEKRKFTYEIKKLRIKLRDGGREQREKKVDQVKEKMNKVENSRIEKLEEIYME